MTTSASFLVRNYYEACGDLLCLQMILGLFSLSWIVHLIDHGTARQANCSSLCFSKLSGLEDPSENLLSGS